MTVMFKASCSSSYVRRLVGFLFFLLLHLTFYIFFFSCIFLKEKIPLLSSFLVSFFISLQHSYTILSTHALIISFFLAGIFGIIHHRLCSLLLLFCCFSRSQVWSGGILEPGFKIPVALYFSCSLLRLFEVCGLCLVITSKFK